MAPQHVEIAETIAGLKRALKREKEAPSDQPIYGATNRGNKLKKGANHVHAGALPYSHALDKYREKVEHAGYTRSILDRNPRRYNEYGDELDESESDAEADADAEDENPYQGIRLEELLCPLKHPSELAMHPTLSIPFLDPALSDMILTTEAKLRQERTSLWRAKYLNRQCIGDESWMPCENVESLEDWDMFEPKPAASVEHNKKKRKRGVDSDPVVNGVSEQDHAIMTDGASTAESVDKAESGKLSNAPHDQKLRVNGDQTQKRKAKNGEDNTTQIAVDDIEMENTKRPQVNGVHEEDKSGSKPTNKPDDGGDPAEAKTQDREGATMNTADGSIEDAPDEQSISGETPPLPTRRITRALAAETNTSNAPTPPLSPTSSVSSVSSSLLQPDPLFLLPPSLAQSQRIPHMLSQLGLPIEEVLETRRLLTMYIQKQEESVRGYENVLAKLIKAKRMRSNLWAWCKAEGHIGEWSDGEDWIDAEAWGVVPSELKKGKDEEEVDGVEEVGRKGKRRRNRE